MELIIDKNTKLNKIENKEDYTSLVIKTKVNPKKLNGFKNVKELTIDYIPKKQDNYNEGHINELSFSKTIEKIIFKNVKNYGIKSTSSKYSTYNLNLPKLKSIEFPSYITIYNSEYLEEAENLEEIIFDAGYSVTFYIDSVMYLYSDNLKRIIIKHKDKEYVIETDYIIGYIDDIDFDNDKIELEYSSNNSNITSLITIDTINHTIKKENSYEISRTNKEIIIPDYVTKISGYEKNVVKKITFNLKLLDYMNSYEDIINIDNIEKLETIELRSNNEMSLNSSIKINIKDYGILKDIYFEDNLLHLIYIDKHITINSKGVINKEIIKKEEQEEQKEQYKKELALKKYTLEELDNYVSYLKLLKLSNDINYKNAMNIVEQELIKKLTK